MSGRQLRRQTRGAFTLIEVLLVMVILVILGSLAVGVFSNTQKKAKIDAAKADIGLIKPQIRLYETHVGELPSDIGALRAAPNDPNAAQSGRDRI